MDIFHLNNRNRQLTKNFNYTTNYCRMYYIDFEKLKNRNQLDKLIWNIFEYVYKNKQPLKYKKIY